MVLVWNWDTAVFISCNRNFRTFPSVKARTGHVVFLAKWKERQTLPEQEQYEIQDWVWNRSTLWVVTGMCLQQRARTADWQSDALIGYFPSNADAFEYGKHFFSFLQSKSVWRKCRSGADLAPVLETTANANDDTVCFAAVSLKITHKTYISLTLSMLHMPRLSNAQRQTMFSSHAALAVCVHLRI